MKIKLFIGLLIVMLFVIGCSVAEVETNKDANSTNEEVEQVEEEVVVEEETEAVVDEDVEYIKNGSFDDGLNNWLFYAHSDASGSYEVVNGEVVISTERDGNEDYSIHMYQDPFNLEVGEVYVLTFYASSSVDRELLIVLDNSSYARNLSTQVTLTSERVEYTWEFEAVEEMVSLKFLLGEFGSSIEDSHTITMDDFMIKKN
jgi:hypothetical protein